MRGCIYLFLFIILCIFLSGCSATPEGLNTAEKLMESNPDSALHILRNIHPNHLFKPSDKALYALLLSQALDKNDVKVESDSLISIATDYYDEKDPVHAGYAWFYRARCAGNGGNPAKQAEALLKAQEFAGNSTDFKLKGFIYGDKAKMYGSQNQIDSSLYYYKLSFRAFKQSQDRRNMLISLLNLGCNYQFYSKIHCAISCYKYAEKLSVPLKDNLLTSTIYKSLGSVYFQENNYRLALDYYNRTPLTGIEIYDYNKWYLLSMVYVQIGQLDSARTNLKKIGNPHELAPDYNLLWKKINEKEGNLKQALYYANRVTITKDSLSQRALSVSFAGLEKKYKYQQLEGLNKDLLIKNDRKSIIILLSVSVLCLLIVGFLMWRLKVEKNHLNVLKQLNEKEMENTQLLEQKVKMGDILLLNVEQYRKHSMKKVNPTGVKQDILNPTLNPNFHQELISCMDIQYKDISGRLLEQYANLTEREILICCLLLANFDTGRIASILDINNTSMNMNRWRLRKKLGLQNNHNLEEFLRAF